MSSENLITRENMDTYLKAIAKQYRKLFKKAAAILGNSESAARSTLRSLVKMGYLTEDMSKVPFLYPLEQHLPL